MMSVIFGLMLTLGVVAQDTLLVAPSGAGVPGLPSGAGAPGLPPEGEATDSHKVQHYTHEQMTEMMVADLKLDEKQTKKVGKLNKKYKTLIEGSQPMGMPGERPSMEKGSRPSGGGFGGGMPGGGMGGPSGMSGGMGGGMPGGGMGGPHGGMPPGNAGQASECDYDKQQTNYEKKLRKLLSDDQYEGYLKLKPQFASQRRIRDFLLGGNAILQ